MSIQAVAWALEQDLPARPKLVLVSIANHANHVDGYCWLKADTIAKEAACTPRSIYNFVGALVRNGYIRKTLRKGEDGKQRATDYWILFDREEKEWDQDANLGPDEADSDPSEIGSDEADAAISCEPPESLAAGAEGEPPPSEPVEIPAGSCGPQETAFHRKRIAEPSKTNPKTPAPGSVPRGYRPPPPQPLGATVEGPAKQIFVYEGSRAYEAWAKAKAQHQRTRKWHLTTRKFVNGQWRIGWYFPSLFPPDATPTSGLTDDEIREFADTG